ncbi:unnamed protein product, partial [Phaeothamnion confervicola]
GRRRSPPRRRASPPRRGTSPNRRSSGSPPKRREGDAASVVLAAASQPRQGVGGRGADHCGGTTKLKAAADVFRPRRTRVPSNVSSLDDDDWVPVSDDDLSLELSPRQKRPSLSVHLNSRADDSYEFTRSGGINLNGFGLEIRETGLGRRPRWGGLHGRVGGFSAAFGGGGYGGGGYGGGGFSEHASHVVAGGGHGVPMRERLAVLCKLGQGATGVVYKAFDLAELRVVALKVVPVFDRVKRRQMLHELRALHDTLARPQAPRPSAPPRPAGVFGTGTGAGA